MVNSFDNEQVQLAYDILKKYTKYTVDLLKGLKSKSSWELMQTIKDYNSRNLTNISNDIIY